MFNLLFFIVAVMVALYFTGAFKSDGFTNAGLYSRDLETIKLAELNGIPEQVLDYKNIPYHKYVNSRHKNEDVTGHKIM